MDIDSNPIGVDYRSHIDDSLKRCDMLLAVIGEDWLGAGEVGSRRIDDPSDLVRLEVTRALARGIRVVPLLIDETEMPSLEELPEDLKGLKFRQAFRVDSGVDFHHHLDRLCAAIEAASPGAAGATDSAAPLPSKPMPAAKQRDEPRDTGPRSPESVLLPRRESEKPPPIISDTPATSERPIAITIICIFGFIGAALSISLIFSDDARSLETWYPPYLAFSAVVGLVCMIGLWKMMKWSVFAYTAFVVLHQIILVSMGVWNILALLVPTIVIAIGFAYLSRMR